MYILKYGHDLEGRPINLYAINNYYQNSKRNAENEIEKIQLLNIEMNNNYVNKIFMILKKVTGRDDKDVHNSVNNLIEDDQKKIENKCNNYDKLQEYWKINKKNEFKEIIE